MMPSLLPRDRSKPLAVFIGGGLDTLARVEPVLGHRAYNVEFVDSDDQPYATVLALKPDIVVVTLDPEDASCFQLLTMLRLDPVTARIPVLSYVKEEGEASAHGGEVELGPMRLPTAADARAQRH